MTAVMPLSQQPEPTGNHLLARRLAEAGLPVFPCLEEDRGAKKAKAPYTSRGFKDATTDVATIDQWWQLHSGAVVGLPTGKISGLSVIDGDIDKETGEAIGEDQIEQLSLSHPGAVQVRTQSGGVQFIFKHVEGAPTSSKKAATHVDTRGDGGYVIAPGSVMANGASYTYEGRKLSDAIEAHDLPDFPLEAFQTAAVAKSYERDTNNAPTAKFEVIDGGQTQATDAETLEATRALLAAAPNALNREDWVKLAVSLRVGFGDTLRDDFITFSIKYIGDNCSIKDAMHVWNSSGNPHSITSIAPALALLKRAVGEEVNKAIWRRVLGSRDARASGGQVRRSGTFRHEGCELIRDEKERPYWNMANACTLLACHPDWAGVLGYNQFTQQKVLLAAIPGQSSGLYPRDLADEDYAAALAWFNENGFPKATQTIADPALRKVCRDHPFDPLVEFLESLSWDGKPRVSTWLTDYVGVTASVYSNEVGRRWMIAAVARALTPGCKADCMLVFEGTQGKQKSTALATLAGENWFSDALPPMNSKDASSYLRGKWIVEVAELEAMKREVDAIKAFLSRQVEQFRPAYGREEVREPRRCVFAGTTNKDNWQRDASGGRRFWPVKTGKIDVAAIARDREQLWAEAVVAFKSGERWWLEGEAKVQAQIEVAARAADDDPWMSDVSDCIRGKTETAIVQVLMTLGINVEKRSQKDSYRAAEILRQLGWARDGRFTSGQFKGQARYIPSQVAK